MASADKPEDDLIREMYARFGLAYYQSECLHRGLCISFAWTGLPSRDLITRPRVEERLAQAFSLTLGDVAAELKGVLPAELVDKPVYEQVLSLVATGQQERVGRAVAGLTEEDEFLTQSPGWPVQGHVLPGARILAGGLAPPRGRPAEPTPVQRCHG